MTRKVRVDFIEHPSGAGYFVALNGRRVSDRFTDSREVAAFAKALGTTAEYAGTGAAGEGTTPSESCGFGEHE